MKDTDTISRYQKLKEFKDGGPSGIPTELEDELEVIESGIEEENDELNTLNDKLTVAEKELASWERSVKILKEQIAEKQTEIADLECDKESVTKEIRNLRNRLDEIENELDLAREDENQGLLDSLEKEKQSIINRL